jgi:hypothetical protein
MWEINNELLIYTSDVVETSLKINVSELKSVILSLRWLQI